MRKEFSPIPQQVKETVKIGDFIIYKGELAIITNDNGSTNNYMIVSLKDGQVMCERYTLSEINTTEEIRTLPEATVKIQIELPNSVTGFEF